jgi:hypothetical protein
MSRLAVMPVTDRTANLAHIANMQRDVSGKSGGSRPKPSNHAGLFLVVRNESLVVRNDLTHAPQALQQQATGILPRHLCWTAFGTFMVGVLCLLIK